MSITRRVSGLLFRPRHPTKSSIYSLSARVTRPGRKLLSEDDAATGAKMLQGSNFFSFWPHRTRNKNASNARNNGRRIRKKCGFHVTFRHVKDISARINIARKKEKKRQRKTWPKATKEIKGKDERERNAKQINRICWDKKEKKGKNARNISCSSPADGWYPSEAVFAASILPFHFYVSCLLRFQHILFQSAF